MMPMNQMSQIDEVRKILLSLLLSRKGPTTIAQLEKEYEGMEGKPVPYRQFDCKDFLSFLESMPAHFTVEPYGNTYNIRGIASEKSKHVSSLVARQKSDQRRYPPPHLRPQFSRRPFKLPPQRVRIASDKLLRLMNYVKSNPNGVSLDHAANYVQKMVPYVMVNKEDLRQQLRELMHQLVVDGNMIYPVVWGNGLPSTSREQPPPLMDQPVLLMEEALLARSQVLSESPSDSASPPTMRIECPAGLEDTDWQHFGNDDNDFVSAGCRVSSRRTKTSEHLVTNLAQHARSKQTDMFNYKVKDDIETSDDDEYFSVVDSKSNTEMKIQDASDMISDRTKSRLEKLLQKHPEGIWCAELPDKYLDEYKVRLSYTKLGFSSVREYTSYLPHIFYMTQTKKTDDFLLFNADKRPIVPKTDPIDIAQSLSKYDEHGTGQAECNNNDDDAPIPSDISPTITKRFAPDDVMTYNDNVEKISVTELKLTRKFLEVYIVEVFHPNFFWIHLRENQKRFIAMMNDLFEFYEVNKDAYTIPKVALKKDMNCACVYASRWHRGIIKTVKPDYKVTVLFYDYGTLKTYAAQDIYYLHKKFSALPAQAIPCGLHNIKPMTGERWKKSISDQFIDKIAETLLAATIITVTPKDNSMLVILTDTSEDEDVNINDWLVNERLALRGKTADVDMASIMKYVLNNANQLPTYCFAEENPTPENLIRQSDCDTTPKQKCEVPLVTPGPTLPHYTNHRPQQPVRPPPGFPPLSEPRIPPSASTRNFYNDHSFANMSNVAASNMNASNVKAPVFGDAEPTTNPFLTDQQFVSSDDIKQMHMSVWNDNKRLQLKVNKILYDLLERSSLSIKDQIQLNKMLKIIERALLEQKNDRSTAVKTPSPSNLMNGTTLNVDVGSPQKASYNLNSETFMNQELNAKLNSFSMSNPFSVNSSDRLQSNAAYSTYGSDGFAFKTNCSQSDEVSPRVQMSPSVTANPTSSIFNHISANTFLPSQENVPLMSPASSSSDTTPPNFSELLDNVKIQFANMLKDTNPFKTSIIEMQQETQNERTAHNYDASFASYLSTTNSHALKMENTNIYARKNCFMPAEHASENYTTKSVYESGPVMYNNTQKRSDVDARLNACNSDNVQNAQSVELGQYGTKLTSQPANDFAASHTQHKAINHQLAREQVNENYLTQSSTYYMPNLQSVNNEPTYYQQNGNVNNSQSVSSQNWKPKHFANSKFQSSASLSNHTENTLFGTPSITSFRQDWNCSNGIRSVPQETNEATDSNYNYKFKDGYDKERSTYAKSRYNTEKGFVQNVASNDTFLFQKIDTVKGVTFLFSFEQDGWILTHEFVETFTNLKLYSRLLAMLEMLNIKVIFKEIQRSQYPTQFLLLDGYPLNVPRDSEKRIISINLISLQSALALLHKLKVISRDEIDMAFKKNEFVEGSVLPVLWTLIVIYRDLKRRIELCSNYI